jgi:magnesium transporter
MQLWAFTGHSWRAVAPEAAVAEPGFHWLALTRDEFIAQRQHWQALVHRLGGSRIVELHADDLSNPEHPSHYDYTSVYDVIVFRRLASTHETQDEADLQDAAPMGAAAPRPKAAQPHPSFERLRTRAVGFVIFDGLLVSVHPPGCGAGTAVLDRLLAEAQYTAESPDAATRQRMPTSPADLAMRMINGMVDSYLAVRRDLSTQLEQWQAELLQPAGRFTNWKALMAARSRLQSLEDLCEEQRDAMAEWLDATLEQPAPAAGSTELASRDQLIVRARDVIEHIERVLHHARRMEQSAETVVQIHFSAQSHRTNDIMRTLTALTAIFLPLNLISSIFGMNFERMPWLKESQGFWWSIALMLGVAATLGIVFWRKRYLARTAK